jgi:regulator of protease activity HflC (stomatin/prohibitin superfamily)
VTAKAEAEAMQIKSQALSSNPGLAQYEAVQKWDGALPQNMYGGGAIPFIGVK